MTETHQSGSHFDRRAGRMLRSILFAFLLAATSLSVAQESGYLEIRGADMDGAEVFLNDSSQGFIESGVLLISTVYPGRYLLRVEQDGLFPTEVPVDVAPGQVTAVHLAAESPSPDSRTEPRRIGAVLQAATASLSLQCFPMACSLLILDGPELLRPDVLREPFEKGFGEAVLFVEDLPTGEYRFEVRDAARVGVEFETGVCQGETIGILADFTRDPIDVTFTRSAYPSCPALPVQSDETNDAAR